MFYFCIDDSVSLFLDLRWVYKEDMIFECNSDACSQVDVVAIDRVFNEILELIGGRYAEQTVAKWIESMLERNGGDFEGGLATFLATPLRLLPWPAWGPRPLSSSAGTA